MLLNVNMVEAEKAAKNVELKKGKPGYNPYEEEEVDELGNVSVGGGAGGGPLCGERILMWEVGIYVGWWAFMWGKCLEIVWVGEG